MPNETAVALPSQMPVAAFTPRDQFELAAREAKVYSQSSLVPKDYQDNPANCLIALNMAKRIGSDPLMTMQSLYIVHGRPGWSGQFLIATFNQCGRFTAMRFEWQGKQGSKDWGCRAFAVERATNEKIIGPWVTWAMVEAEGWSKKAGSKWLTMPEIMFTYRAAAFLVRTHAPEIAMGLQTAEEAQDVIDVTPIASTPSATLASINEAVAPAPKIDAPKQAMFTVGDVRAALHDAKTLDDLDSAAALIDSLPAGEHRDELRTLYHTRRESMVEAA